MQKTVLSSLILLLSSVFFFPLFLRMFGQLHYSKAAGLMRTNQYEYAIVHLKKATELQGGEARNWKALGDSYHFLGLSKPFMETYGIALKAKESYAEALRLNSIDAENFFGLGIAERRLEQLFPYFYSGQNPHDPIPYLHKAISLYPKNLQYHFFLADYYFSKKEMSELIEEIEHTATLSPDSYDFFRKQPLWEIPEVKESFKQGLLKTINEKINETEAHKVMAAIFENDKDWNEALFHYQQSPVPEERRKAAQHYFHLGRLYEYAGNSNANPEYLSKAIQYYQNALAIDRRNDMFRKQHEALSQKLDGKQ